MKPKDKTSSPSKVDKTLDNNPIRGFQLPLSLPKLNLSFDNPIICPVMVESVFKLPTIFPSILSEVIRHQVNLQKFLVCERDYLNILIDLRLIRK